MEKLEVEIFEYEPHQSPVLRMPGRQFPGYLIQGDSLNEYRKTVRIICKLADDYGNEELKSETRNLLTKFERIMQRYEAALSKHGLPLPYPAID
jgi:hypothetical protein